VSLGPAAVTLEFTEDGSLGLHFEEPPRRKGLYLVKGITEGGAAEKLCQAKKLEFKADGSMALCEVAGKAVEGGGLMKAVEQIKALGRPVTLGFASVPAQ
jgi:hypothetical protein